jgi:beta-lactam-binding protein with PASTA domain
VMPNFVGQPLATATNLLQNAGMRMGKVTVANSEPAATNQASTGGGTPSSSEATSNSPAQPTPAPPPTPSPSSLILAQSPAAGQKIVVGTAIEFEVSR